MKWLKFIILFTSLYYFNRLSYDPSWNTWNTDVGMYLMMDSFTITGGAYGSRYEDNSWYYEPYINISFDYLVWSKED